MRLKPARMKKIITLAVLFTVVMANAQQGDHIYQPNIKSVKLFRVGDIYSYPIMVLNSGDLFELHFDDMDGDIKNYYYSFQLCNADWTPTTLFPYDYIKGFQSNRIQNYRHSSIALTQYTHYQAQLPDRNCMPSRSGNYLLKVFLNDDTSRLAFTQRFLVVENKVSLAATIQQPISGQLYRTHQRVQVGVSTANARFTTFGQNDLKIVVVQNYIWPTAIMVDRPTIFRGNYFEYSDDALSFPAGKEWRWIDLNSLRLMSDRMKLLDKGDRRTDVYVKPDADRTGQPYIYYRDLDGLYAIENTDGNNPYWQSDYAYTHFTFVPPGNRPLAGTDLYLFGELTGYNTDDSSKMVFNETTGVYERTLLLKQGFYNYSYATLPQRPAPGAVPDIYTLEGNYPSSENTYMVLVYYRSFGGRADELVGYSKLNSLPGF